VAAGAAADLAGEVGAGWALAGTATGTMVRGVRGMTR
jgi:hypothetical protein